MKITFNGIVTENLKFSGSLENAVAVALSFLTGGVFDKAKGEVRKKMIKAGIQKYEEEIIKKS